MYQSVLVTGASSGIGEATAVLLAHHGFRVFAAARRIEKLQELAGLAGGRITPVAMDITDDGSVERALDEINSADATLYGLVNNAGVSVTGPIEQVEIDEWRRQYETNVFGLVRVTQKILPVFRKAGRGRVINIGSIAGRIAPPFLGAYASSKHAVEGVSDSLRRELAPHGVKVSLIRPGFINTPFGHQEQDGFEKYLGADQPYDGQLRIFKSWHAKGHPTAPPPTVVAEAVHKALTAERPQARYTAPTQTLGLLMLRNFLPSAIVDRIFERVTGLNSFKKSE
ncbi:MAG: SDR family oxidoreductase [Pseudomonadota bacterium]